ncbi:MAG: glycolate oxidase subunit GlcE [Rubrivivax sp.]|nr:glycolate oxidase subunit GlcE [Rubrivivax sp.]
MVADPALSRLINQVQVAASDRAPLDIRGGGSKSFYGGEPVGEPLDVTPLAGISSYEPSELVVTVRAGTKLSDLEAVLAEKGQCLPFEPPRFAASGTVGGMVAAGMAGPARAAVGGVRDYVLGATMINGRAELLSFGGQVMKNVAGYDVSRVLAGSMGIFGVICEVSLKVLPIPPASVTLRLEMDAGSAIRRLNEWGGQPLPLNASAWWDGMLVLRLSGAEAAVKAAQDKIGGELIAPAAALPFWQGMRDHSDEFFVGASRAVDGGACLWRLSVPATAGPLKLSGEQLLEWGGAQRWICTSAPAQTLRDVAAAVGGHAVLFRARDKSAATFAPLKPALAAVHQQLKQAFDPERIFNPGRLVPGL